MKMQSCNNKTTGSSHTTPKMNEFAKNFINDEGVILAEAMYQCSWVPANRVALCEALIEEALKISELYEEAFDVYWCDECNTWSQYKHDECIELAVQYHKCEKIKQAKKKVSFDTEPRIFEFDSDIEEVEEETATIVRKRVCFPQLRYEGPYMSYGHRNNYEFKIHVRSVMLLYKLRAIIKSMRVFEQQERLKTIPIYKASCSRADPEMDRTHGESEGSTSTSNVVLGETQSDSSDVAAPLVPYQWYKYSSTEENPQYSNLVDRDTLYKVVEWTAEDKVFEEDMPVDFIRSIGKNRTTMPMFIPFHIHQYWRGDMEFRFHLNSNKFQSGMLIAAWVYLGGFRSKSYLDIHTLYQCPHVILNAGAINEATLLVPYRYFKPYIQTKCRDGINCLNLGKLIIRPLAPLRSTSKVYGTCNFSIFIRFINSSFTGLVDGGIALPEMMRSILTSLGSKLIGTAIDAATGISDTDNPSENQPPSFFVPTASHNWSAGTGISEPIHRLGLDLTRNYVVHGESSDSSMNINYITSIFGLLKPIVWSTNDMRKNKAGALLWSMNVHPQGDKSKLNANMPEQDHLKEYTIPPVGVIASLFELWRGSIEFKFEVVATGFHSGRLLCAYIPGVSATVDVPIEQARNSAHVVFSLNEATSFTFLVPFISDKPWWNRKYGGPQRRTEMNSPSLIKLYVLNPLIPMDAVASELTILISMRGGPDFEVAVPVQPSIGLNRVSANIPNTARTVTFKVGYYPVYAGSWHNFFEGKKYIIRYGNVSEHIAQLENPPKPGTDAFRYWVATTPTAMIKVVEPGASIMRAIKFGVAWNLDGYWYMIPFADSQEIQAKSVARELALSGNINKVEAMIPTYYEDSDWFNNRNNVVWQGKDSILVHTIQQMVMPEMQRGDAPNVMQPTRMLPGLSFGANFFGENFSSLKSLMRRYQLYWEDVVHIPNALRDVNDLAILQMPILPAGLDLPVSRERPLWNSMRDGHIPIICSGYTYFRGGLRFRIVFSEYEGVVWVQHHPDKPLIDRKAIVCADIHRADRYKNHSYGFYIQDTRINRIVEIEIPYYLPGTNGIVCPVKGHEEFNNYSGLGDLVIGLEGYGASPDRVHMSIYYSVADDFELNTFVGFENKVFTDETAFPEMDFMATVANSLCDKNYVKNQVADGIKEGLAPIVDEFKSSLTEGVNALDSTLDKGFIQMQLINGFGQFLQVMANPTPTSIAIAICSMLGSIVMASVETFLQLQKSLISVLSKYWGKCFASNDSQAGASQADPEGFMEDMSDKECHGFLGLLFSIIAGTIAVGIKGPKHFPKIMKDVKECLNVCNSAVQFFRNIVDAVVYFYKYCIGETDEKKRIQSIVEQEHPHIKDWVEESLNLLDPRLKARLQRSANYANRLFDACIYGSIIIGNNLDVHMPSGRVIAELYNKICKLRDDIINMGNHPDVRFECYPIWMCGDAGIGKTFLTSEFCKVLLQHINFTTSESMVYWLALGQKHWNGVGNPPVIARDEAYCMRGSSGDEEIAMHLAICSSSILNPPMASIEDKNKRLNPLIYYMNSNTTFPDIVEARCPEAIYRRRRLMVKAEYTPYIKEKYPNITDASAISPSERMGFKHLQFSIASDPKDVKTAWSPPMDYDKLCGIAKRRFKAFYEQERVNFKRRMAVAYALDPEVSSADLEYEIGDARLGTESLHEKFIKRRVTAREHLNDMEAPDDVSDDPFYKRCWDKARHYFKVVPNPEMDNDSDIVSDDDEFAQWMHEEPVPLVPIGPSFKEQYMDSSESEVSYGDCGVDTTEGHLDEFTAERMGTFSFRFRKMTASPEVETPPVASTSQDRDSIGRKIRDRLVSEYAIKVEIVTKLYSNNDLQTAELSDFNGFALTNEYKEFIAQETNKYRYWIGERVPTFLPGVRENACWSAIASKDCQYRWRKQFPAVMSHTDKSGMDHLRWYVFHLIRQWQYYAIAKDAEIRKKYEEVVGFSAFDKDPSNREEWNKRCTALADLTNLGYGKDVCRHMRVWSELIMDTSKARFNYRTGMISYVDHLGLRNTIEAKCTCTTPVPMMKTYWENPIFKKAMKMIWNHDHGTVEDNVGNPFAFKEYEDLRDKSRNFVQRAWDWCRDWWMVKAWPWVSSVLRFIYTHFAAGCMIWGVLSAAWALLAKRSFGQFASETYDSARVWSAFNFSRNRTTSAEGPKYYDMDKGKPATSRDKPATKESMSVSSEVLEKKIQNNFITIRCSFIDEEQRKEVTARCLGIRNHQIVIIRHYVEEFRKLSKRPGFKMEVLLNINNVSSVQSIRIDDFEDIHYLEINGKKHTSNIGVMHLPRHFPQFRNILSSIATCKEHANAGTLGDFISTEGSTRHNLRLDVQKKLYISGDDTISQITVDMVYKYPHHGPGLCGSIVVSPNICKGNWGIIGIHVAGRTGIGFAEAMCREYFDNDIVAPKYDYKLPEFEKLENAAIKLDSNVLLLGTVDQKFAHRESGKSKIVPSLLHDQIYPVLTEVNPLKPNDPRQGKGAHPLRDGCEKHGAPPGRPFPKKDIEMVSAYRKDKMIRKIKPTLIDRRPLTLEEQVCGSTVIPHCESLKWTSSEGFPLSSYRPRGESGKQYLFDLELLPDGYKLLGLKKELLALLEEEETNISNRVISPPIYIDCLKDYRLPPAKCRVWGKTRIFSIAPVQTTMLVRKYAGLYLSAYKENVIYAGHGIGINPDSLQWTQLADYLLEVGTNIVTGDYSNYGPTLSSELVSFCIDDICFWHEWYEFSAEHVERLKICLTASLLTPVHLCNNLVYQVYNGISSGSPVTAELNSDVNEYYLLLAFVGLNRQLNKGLSLSDFAEKVRLITYGDDFIMSVHDELIEWYNCQTISEYLKEYGITLTDANKGDTISPFDTLFNSTFLKRSFKPHPTRVGVYLAPLEPRSITEVVNWCHKQNNMVEATKENCRASLVLAFGQGPEFYEEHRQRILRGLAFHDIEMLLERWDDVDAKCFD